ncbi:uncharacterized Rho GTPase-activating protein [Tanacetum coccineum]
MLFYLAILGFMRTIVLNNSGTKLKEAGQSAGSFVGEVAKDAKGNVSDVAGRVGSVVKSRCFFLRRGVSETKEKVVVGKTKVEEVAKKTAQKSKTLLTDIERWQKGVASTDVFGVPLEVTVQRQDSTKPVPFLLIKCADFLVLSGLNSPDLFKSEGNKKAIQQLVSLYNQDLNAPLPEGVNPIDVAALVKCYLASLPQPLITLDLHNEIRGVRSSIPLMRNILKKLPTVNYMTLELVTALLLRVSQKSLLNKMDAGSLAMEMAPIIMWQKGQRPETYRQFWNQPSKPQSNTNVDPVQNYNEWDMLADEDEDMDASSAIPLDDGTPIDFSAIEVLQCLIEHHNAIFTDANETVWSGSGQRNPLDSHDYMYDESGHARKLNGSPTEEFQFFKGLKQGDPLSPFIFILVMESLHISFKRVVDAGMFNGIVLNSVMQFSHSVAMWDDAGLSINLSKSKLLGVVVSEDRVVQAVNKIGCGVLKAPFAYLGSKVGGNMSRIKFWDEIVDKMKCLAIDGILFLGDLWHGDIILKQRYPRFYALEVSEEDCRWWLSNCHRRSWGTGFRRLLLGTRSGTDQLTDLTTYVEGVVLGLHYRQS